MTNSAKKKFRFDYDTPLNSSSNPKGTPERNLLMAILERAILDYVGNETAEVEKAQKWIFGSNNFCNKNSDDYDPLSFYWVCTELDLDPEKIAAAIKAMPKRGNRRTAPWYWQKAA